MWGRGGETEERVSETMCGKKLNKERQEIKKKRKKNLTKKQISTTQTDMISPTCQPMEL